MTRIRDTDNPEMISFGKEDGMTQDDHQHCDHECNGNVCYYYRDHYPRLVAISAPCDCKCCSDDTRSRPAPTLDFCDECSYNDVCARQAGESCKEALARCIAAKARENVLKSCCEKCPIRNEELPLEDYSAESCEGCLIRTTVESLRTGGGK